MNTQIEKKQYNDLSKIVFNPIVKSNSNSSSELLIARIESMSHHLRIDFVYKSSHRYINGGWISMEPGCYVESVDKQFRSTLVRADNIPLTPNKHHFTRCGELWSFTLWFTPMPEFVTEINFIEKLNGRQSIRHSHGNIFEVSGNYFNFFGIQLNKSQNISLEIPSN